MIPRAAEASSASAYSSPFSAMTESLSRMLPMNNIACSPLIRCLPVASGLRWRRPQLSCVPHSSLLICQIGWTAPDWPDGGCGPRKTQEPAPTYRKTLSFFLAEISQVAFFADLLQHLIRGGGGQGLPGVKYPDAVLLPEWPCPTDRTQSDLLAHTLHVQSVPGLQMQLFPQRLGDNDAACFINGEAGVHSGIIPWVDPWVNAILSSACSLYLSRIQFSCTDCTLLTRQQRKSRAETAALVQRSGISWSGHAHKYKTHLSGGGFRCLRSLRFALKDYYRLPSRPEGIGVLTRTRVTHPVVLTPRAFG